MAKMRNSLSLQNLFANFFANMNRQQQNELESVAPADLGVERFVEVLKAYKEPKETNEMSMQPYLETFLMMLRSMPHQRNSKR